MTEVRAWLSQAQADWRAGERAFDRGSTETYCHTIAKCQQAVEKSIKALILALRDHRGLGLQIGWTHPVERFLSVLIRLPRSPDNRSIQSLIHRVLDEKTWGDIRALERLIPRKPAPGTTTSRNTEHPFEQDGQWRYPAGDGVFDPREIERFRNSRNDPCP